MKTFFLVVLLATNLVLCFAQPTSGFYFGGNYTFVESEKRVFTRYNPQTSEYQRTIYEESYSPLLGWQLGYTASIKINNPTYLTLGANITQKRARFKTSFLGQRPWSEIDEEAFYICAPIAINYAFGKFYAGFGYEFGYDPGMSGTLSLHEYSHAVLLQAGYNIWFFDVVAKYAYTFNKQNVGNAEQPEHTPQNSILQLSLVIGSPTIKRKNEK